MVGLDRADFSYHQQAGLVSTWHFNLQLVMSVLPLLPLTSLKILELTE